MKKILSIILSAFAVLSAPAVSAENVREVLSLDKGWRFHKGDIPFPEIKGHSISYNNAKAGQAWGAASATYDDSSWRIVDLPHDWAIEGRVDSTANISQGYYHRGIGWYRRQFRLSPEDNGKHIELQFDGIATHATIWVNGTVLHRNWCGYTSMYIDITPYVTYGDKINTVAVRVDADAQEGWWYEGAGIYRHTWLVKRSPLHIITDGVYANPVKKDDGKWEIPVEVTLYNIGEQPAKGNVEVEVYDPDGSLAASGKATAETGVLATGTVSLPLTVSDPLLWSPDSPVLYKVIAKVTQNGRIVDSAETKCGFRTVRFDAETGFWLNGKNIRIKGVCNHQDHAGVGVAVPDALWEFRLRKLKEMGVNAYRAAHNPMSKEFMDACDSMGIMVMDENRIFNTSPEYGRQLEWLVRRDRNRPSVILWSVFNEEPMQGTENGYEMVRRMYSAVRKLDTTRPVTAAMNGGFFSEYNVSQAVDVGGFNYQIDSYDRFHKENPQLPLTSSEDGSAFMVRGEYRTDKSRNIIDSYDSEATPWGATHRHAWRAVAERPWLAGCFYWTGFDYHGEPTPFEWPSVSSFFGILDLCGFPKAAYYLHQAQWIENRPVLEIIPHWNWPADSLGRAVKVMVFSNVDKVRLKLNGKTVSEQDVDPYEMNTWEVPYKPGRLEAIGYKGGKVVAKSVVETAGEAVSLRLTPYRSSMTSDRDAVPVTLDAVDSKGRHVPVADDMVTFSISGPGSIIGLGNGNPNSHEPEKGDRRSLFNGLAQVIVQAEGEAGKIVLTASAPGLEPAEVVIPVSAEKGLQYVPEENSAMILDSWTVSPLSVDRPDIDIHIPDNDMNSWQPVQAGEYMDMEETGYVILRTRFRMPSSIQATGGRIVLKQVAGKAEIWLNGKKLGEKTEIRKADLTADIPAGAGNCDLRILLCGQAGSVTGIKLAEIREK